MGGVGRENLGGHIRHPEDMVKAPHDRVVLWEQGGTQHCTVIVTQGMIPFFGYGNGVVSCIFKPKGVFTSAQLHSDIILRSSTWWGELGGRTFSPSLGCVLYSCLPRATDYASHETIVD